MYVRIVHQKLRKWSLSDYSVRSGGSPKSISREKLEKRRQTPVLPPMFACRLFKRSGQTGNGGVDIGRDRVNQVKDVHIVVVGPFVVLGCITKADMDLLEFLFNDTTKNDPYDR